MLSIARPCSKKVARRSVNVNDSRVALYFWKVIRLFFDKNDSVLVQVEILLFIF